MNRFVRGAIVAGVGGAAGFLISDPVMNEIIGSPGAMERTYERTEDHIAACAAAISGLSTEVTALPEPCRDEEFPREVTTVQVERFDPHEVHTSDVDTRSTTIYKINEGDYVESELDALATLRSGNGGFRTGGKILFTTWGVVAGLMINHNSRRRRAPDVVEDGSETV